MTTHDTNAPAVLRSILDRRWSCRAFLPQDVPTDTIASIFEMAQRTASWCNTQPWHAHVLSGDARRRFSEGLLAHVREHDVVADLPLPTEYVGVYQERRRDAGYRLYGSLGIRREDREARETQYLQNYALFGAPHVAIITTDRAQGVYGAVDCGAYVANLLNAATSLGIATIPQASISMHSDYVREALSLADDRLVVCAVSFGYPDLEHPANSFRTSRSAVADAVTYLNDENHPIKGDHRHDRN